MVVLRAVSAITLLTMASLAEKPAPVVTPPRVIDKPAPQYTQEGSTALVEGKVIVRGEVDEAGRLTGARVIKPLGYGLDERALRCAEQWRFQPATRDGVPTRVSIAIEINFRLPPRQ